MFVAAAGETQVAKCFVINREDCRSGAVFRAHVSDGGAIGQWDLRDALAIELDKLADHTVLTKHFRDDKNKVCGGSTSWHGTSELETNNARNEH